MISASRARRFAVSLMVLFTAACNPASEAGNPAPDGGVTRAIRCDENKLHLPGSPLIEGKESSVLGDVCRIGREGFCGTIPPNFCLRSLLYDVWPVTIETQAHCSIACTSDSECPSKYSCCTVRKDRACLVKRSYPCERWCPTNQDCEEGTYCCEKLSKVCVADHCNGVCVDR